jgi:hypothetical protein
MMKVCNKSESITNLAKALVAFNVEVKIIEKDAQNPHFKNHYASLDTIIDDVRPLLAKHGLSMMQFPGGDGEKFTLRSMLLHESGEWIESEPITMRPVKNDPQGIGSCSTYARRYSLSAMLSLNTGEDDDGNGATQPGSQQSTNTSQSYSQSNTSQTGQSSGAFASEGQVKMLYAKHKATGFADMKEVCDYLKRDITKFAEVPANDVTRLAQWLDKQKAA